MNGMATPDGTQPPRWGALYAGVGLALLIGFLGWRAAAPGVPESIGEFGTAAAVLAVMALWVRGNRKPLARSGRGVEIGQPRVRRVVHSTPVEARAALGTPASSAERPKVVPLSRRTRHA